MQVDFVDISLDAYRNFFEAYVSEIVNKVPDTTGKIIVRCINTEQHSHNDTNASAFCNISNGVYYCSVCGSFSAYSFLTDIIGLNEADSANELSNYVDNTPQIKHRDNFAKTLGAAPIQLTNFAIECHQRLQPDIEIIKDYCSKRGIKYSTLKSMGVGYLPSSDTQKWECITFPYYLNGKVIALRGRTIDNRKGGIAGSRYTLLNLDNVTRETNGVIICEGESDTLRVQQLLNDNNIANIVAIGVAGSKFNRGLERELQDIPNIYILPQSDEASFKMAIAIKEIFKQAKILTLKWNKGELGKDVCDFLFYHSEQEILNQLKTDMQKKFALTYQELMLEANKEYQWIIPNIFGRGEKIMIGGIQKSMKTFLTLFIIRSLVLGENLFNSSLFPVKQHKVLMIEEEGSTIGLAKRFKSVIGDIDTDNLRVSHKPSIKLDTAQNMSLLYKEIEDFEPDVLILDPLQRMIVADEDSATDMLKVWDTIHGLTVKYPNMAVIIIHHFKKGGDNEFNWDSFRGSSRTAGEADVMLAVQRERKRALTGEVKLNVRLDGREVPELLINEGQAGIINLLLDTNNWSIQVQQHVTSIPIIEETIESKVLNFLGNKPQSTIQDIVGGTGIKQVLVSNLLNELVDKKVRRVRGDVKGQMKFVWECIN